MTAAFALPGEGAARGRSVAAEVPVSFLGPTARRILAFEFVVLLEYFLAPPFLGITNYAGTWSEIGTALFVVLAVSLLTLVVVPLWPRIFGAVRSRADRGVFFGVWVGTFVTGLFLTNVLQFPDETASSFLVGQTTIYTPLGAWPSLTVYVPRIDLWAVLNVEQTTLLFLLAFLAAGSLALARSMRCDDRSVRAGEGWRARAARWLSVGSLGPIGLVTACPTCMPAYFSLIALVAPGVAESSYLALPLVPWLGLAGLLYVAGFALVIRSLRWVDAASRAAAPGTGTAA